MVIFFFYCYYQRRSYALFFFQLSRQFFIISKRIQTRDISNTPNENTSILCSLLHSCK